MVGRERLLWVDLMKAVFIVVVVLFHCSPHRFYIMSVYPVFFAIAGFLFNPQKYDSFLTFARHRCRQILVPYLLFGVVFYALWLGMAWVHVHRTGEAVNYWGPLVEMTTGYPTTILGAYWFANCLLVMQLVYWALLRWVPQRWHLLVTCVLSALSYYMYYTEFWSLTYMVLFMPFYVFGVQCKSFLSQRHLTTGWHLLVATIAAVAIMWLLNHAMNHWHREVHNLLMLVLQFGLVTYFFEMARWLAGLIKGTWLARAATFVSVNALVYLAAQNDVILYLHIFADRVLHWPNDWSQAIAITIVTLLICAALAWGYQGVKGIASRRGACSGCHGT